MDYNILIGGAAGQGMDSVTHTLNKVLQKNGLYVYTTADYLSRVRGGHNFFQIRFSDNPLNCHKKELDLIFALNEETIKLHQDRLKNDGVIFGDQSFKDHSKLKKFDFIKKAKLIGNERVFTSIGLATIMRHFGLDLNIAETILKDTLKKDLIDMNIEALRYGYELFESSSKYDSNPSNTILVDGNSSVGFGAIAAGCKFYCGYPMTPSSGILGFMEAASDDMSVVVDQVEDEVAALNMALGATYAGVRAMTGSSGGGIALMQEAISLSGAIESPVVIVNVQRPAPATGLPTYTEQADLRFMIHAGHGEFPRLIIALRNAEDAFLQTVRAFNIAEKYQIPVILLSDQYLADSNVTIPPFPLEKVKIERSLANPDDYAPGEYKRYAFTESGISPRLIPGKANGNIIMVDSDEHDEFGRIDESSENRKNMVDKRHKKSALLLQELEEPLEIGDKNPTILIASWGSTYGIVKEAVHSLNSKGYKILALSFGDIYPLPTVKLKKYLDIVDQFIVVEQNKESQLEGLIRQMLLIKADHLITKYDGRPFYAEDLEDQIVEVIK